jgi:hypothetical protein
MTGCGHDPKPEATTTQRVAMLPLGSGKGGNGRGGDLSNAASERPSGHSSTATAPARLAARVRSHPPRN